jgi:BirA family biotin operon repressor/biotin-[acetyl-CoA-carboxylase] ligase
MLRILQRLRNACGPLSRRYAASPECSAGIGWDVFHFPEIDSTNSEALRRAKGLSRDRMTVISADAQLGGRGSRGRTWFSPPDSNLYLSLCTFEPLSALEVLPLYTHVAALACLEALREAGVFDVRIKWPNDVLLNERKLGGILCEADSSVDSERVFVVAGIGLNVNMTDFPIQRPVWPATSLRVELGRPFDRQALSTAIAARYIWLCQQFRTDGYAPVSACLKRHWYGLGRVVRVRTSSATGESVVSGVMCAPGDMGLLRLQLSDGSEHDYPLAELLSWDNS